MALGTGLLYIALLFSSPGDPFCPSPVIFNLGENYSTEAIIIIIIIIIITIVTILLVISAIIVVADLLFFLRQPK